MAKKLDGYSFTLFSIIFIYLSFKAVGFTLTIFNFSISIAYDKDDGILFETSAQQNEYKKWKQQERKERAERDKRLSVIQNGRPSHLTQKRNIKINIVCYEICLSG